MRAGPRQRPGRLSAPIVRLLARGGNRETARFSRIFLRFYFVFFFFARAACQARRLDPAAGEKYPALCREAEDALLLYAEHTWGHSSTITDPCDTMVLDLDMRKNSYASKAHEAASRLLGAVTREKGDTLRYYNTSGTLRVLAPGGAPGPQPVEFYVETLSLPRACVRRDDGTELPCQVSPHPRGRRITFLDDFTGVCERRYAFAERPPLPETLNSRRCYVGAERVRDIVNDYDPVSFRLPYGYENR